MRVLIIGSKGMLGQELVRVFYDADVLAWDREQIDITNHESVRERVRAVAPALIINAAAYNAVDKAETESELANRVNGDAVGFLAAAAAEIGATFVHYSTDYIFHGTSRVGYSEDDVPNPVNAYGRSKLTGERALSDAVTKWPNSEFGHFGHLPRWYLIRTSRLFGRQGASPDTKRSFVDTMVALSATKDRLELIDEEVSSPTYAPDLAVATREIVFGSAYPRHLRDGSASSVLPSGIYHRTNDGSCTWYGFAKEIFQITGWRGTTVPVPASIFPRPAQRPAFSALKTTKLPPMRRWEDALREYLTENSEILNPKS